MKKKTLNRFTKLWSVLLLIFAMAATMSVPVAAIMKAVPEDQSDKIFLIAGMDSEGNVVSCGGGFIVENADGSVFIVTDISVESEDADYYSLVYVEDMISYDLEITGRMTDYCLLTLDFSDGAPSSSHNVTLDYPVQDSLLHWVYFDDNIEKASDQIRLTDATPTTVGSTEIMVLEGDTVSDDAFSNGIAFLLAGLIDDDGNLIGVYSSSAAGTFFSLMSDTEEFHSEEAGAETEEEVTESMTEEDADADNLAKDLLDI